MPLRPFEDVDTRLVVERDRGLGVDRQAVAPEVEAVVDDEAAHREVVDVALGVVGVAHRRIEARSGRRGGARRRRGAARRRSTLACSGACASGTSPQPATLAGGGALPVTVTGASVGRARCRAAGAGGSAPCARASRRRRAEGQRERERAWRAMWKSVDGHRRVDGRALGRRADAATAGSACFPARGLPQSGSKGLSQSGAR